MKPTRPEKFQPSDNISEWQRKQAEFNGLSSPQLQPWHIVIEYDQFDEDGDNVHSGVLEEFWAGPKHYKRTYKSDNLNQTDYATDKGLFRLGDQRWPGPIEGRVRTDIDDPFSYATALEGRHTVGLERSFGAHSLDCVAFERNKVNGPGPVSIPQQYCFDHGGSALRYIRGRGWDQIAHNDVIMFQGRSVARDVDVTDAGKPFLKLHVKTIETIAHLDEEDFLPPAAAVALRDKRVSGVSQSPIKMTFPEWPASMRQQHFSVKVDIVVGKDGHVLAAHAVSGPPGAYKAAEKTAQKWLFHPYMVLDEPTEVESSVILSNS